MTVELAKTSFEYFSYVFPTFSKSYAVVDYFKIPSDIDVHNLYFAITLKLFP